MNHLFDEESNQINNRNSYISTSTNPLYQHKYGYVDGHKRERLIKRDGHANIQRLNVGDRYRYLKDLFTSLLDLSWLYIIILFISCFFTSWLLFSLIWYVIMYINGDFSHGNSNSTDVKHIPCVHGVKSYRGTFLFAIETQQTIGYGTRSISEECTVGIILMVFQTCFGLILQSLWVGLVYTRLSRPRKRRQTLIWSKKALILMRDGILTFQCRLADMRSRSTLAEAHVRMYFISKYQTEENEMIPINLIDMNVGFDIGTDRIILDWPTIIQHKIDQNSPLYDFDKQNISNRDFEILVVLEGIIEPTGMVTQTKISYVSQEIIWGARFSNMIHFRDHSYFVDFSKFDQFSNDNATPHYSAKQLQENNLN